VRTFLEINEERRKNMRKIMLASHGSLAEGMKSAAVMILGESFEILAYGLDTFITPQSILQEIRNEMELATEDEYLILCDIKGGSVHNCLMELCTLSNVCIVTGMNLSLVLELSILSPTVSLNEEIDEIISVSKDNIQCFNKKALENLLEEEEDSLW
jgi:PTS system mannose-specific IIA component/fructoselysine and glucoselysine-specific PTS system IIA component